MTICLNMDWRFIAVVDLTSFNRKRLHVFPRAASFQFDEDAAVRLWWLVLTGWVCGLNEYKCTCTNVWMKPSEARLDGVVERWKKRRARSDVGWCFLLLSLLCFSSPPQCSSSLRKLCFSFYFPYSSSATSSTSFRSLHQLCFSKGTNGHKCLSGIIEEQPPTGSPENPAPWLYLCLVEDLSNQQRNTIHQRHILRKVCKKRLIAASANRQNYPVI